MSTENFEIQNNAFVASVDTLGDGNDFTVTPAKLNNAASDEYGWYWTTTFITGAACDVKYLTAPGGDFATPDSEITVDSFDGNGISEGNKTPLVLKQTALRLTNTSGSPADYAVIGWIDDETLPDPLPTD